MASKITHWLLVALVLSLGFGQLLRFDYFDIHFYLHDLLVVAIIVTNLRSIFVGNPAGRLLAGKIGPKLLLVGLLLGWINALTVFNLETLGIPFLYTARLLSYLLLYYVLHATKTRLNASLWLLSGGISIVIGMLQYILMPDMRVFQYLGWDDHLNRITLPHYDPTFSSIFFTLFGLLAIDLKKYWLGVAAIPAILLSYARSTWLSLAFTYISKYRRFSSLFIVICLLIIPFFVLPTKNGEGTNLMRTYSISSRLQHDWSLLSKGGYNSIFGVGYNTFALQAKNASGANNSYLQILLTTGILGLVGAILMLHDFMRTFKHRSTLFFVLCSSLFNNVLLYPFVLLWLITLSVSYNDMDDQT